MNFIKDIGTFFIWTINRIIELIELIDIDDVIITGIIGLFIGLIHFKFKCK